MQSLRSEVQAHKDRERSRGRRPAPATVDTSGLVEAKPPTRPAWTNPLLRSWTDSQHPTQPPTPGQLQQRATNPKPEDLASRLEQLQVQQSMADVSKGKERGPPPAS